MSDIKNLVEKFRIKIPEKMDSEGLIVLVENQTDMRLIVSHQLNKLGFKNIKQFSNGHEALEWMRNSPPCMMSVADSQMPLLNGYELLVELKNDPNLSRGPFAITMDNPSREKIMFATESGVDGILVKPFTLKDILPKVRQAFKVFHNPNNPELLYEKAKNELRDGHNDIAKAVYQSLSNINPQAARPLVGMAHIAFLEGDYSSAESLLDEAQKRNEHFVHIFVERGDLFLKLDRLQESVDQFKHAITLSPLNPVRYERAAELLFKVNKHQEAVDILSIAIKNELSFPALHNYLSQGYFKLKEYKKAIKHIRSALSIDPENVIYLNQLGISYKESGESEAALKTYNQTIKLDPDNRAALYNKAILLNSQNNSKDAIKTLERCLSKHPDFQQARDKLTEFQNGSGEAAS